MSFREYTIKYKSVSLPSVHGENNIEILLQCHADKWSISRTLGFIYEQESMTVEVDTREVERLFEHLSGLRLPALPEGIWGLDGTTHTLAINHAMNSATYEWWVELPEGFKPLKEIILKLFEFAEIDPSILEEILD